MSRVGLGVFVCTAALFVLPGVAAGADRTSGGTVERRTSEDGADLLAEESTPGGSADGTDGCSFWDAVTLSGLGLVPPELAVGLQPGDNRLTRDLGGFVQTLHVRTCPDQVPRTQYRWFDDVPGLRPLVLQARESLVLPLPSPEFSPPAASVRTLVGVDTWFWVPEADWAPVEATAEAGTVSVTATATPVLLRFEPGDGSAAVTCPGPGEPWTNDAETSCSYTYQWVSAHHPDGRWPAAVQVEWEVTWSASTGHSGVLEPFVMVTDVALVVAEAEAVLTLRGR